MVKNDYTIADTDESVKRKINPSEGTFCLKLIMIFF